MERKALGSLSVVLKSTFVQGGGLHYPQERGTRPQLELLNNLRVGCKLFWQQVTEVCPENPGMLPPPCPPRRTGLGFHLACTHSPSTRPGGGNPRSRFVNRVLGAGGGGGGREGRGS